MKKALSSILAAILVAVMLFSLVECKPKNEEDNGESPFTPIVSVTPSTDPPSTNVPETNVPETNVPETNAPETNTPETNTPETNGPETNTPETNPPETNTPETNTPETNTPETNGPETNTPETNTPETNAPETNAPETNAPETNPPETDDTHKHSYGNWVEVVSPTCREDGRAEASCSCGTKTSKVLPAKGHSEAIDPAVAPTCVKEGLTEGKHCSDCGTVILKQTSVPKLDHTYTWVVDREATETSTGLKHEQCSCGAKRNENTVIEKKQCSHSNKKTAAVAATCEKDGNIEYYTCSKCKRIFSDKNGNLEIELSDTVIKAKGHNIVTDPAVNPTCVKEGLTEGKHCSACGKVTVKQNSVPKLAHTYTWVVDREATETSTGIKHEQCSCGAKRNENTVIEKKQCAHSNTKTSAVAATCEKAGNTEYYTCSKCKRIFSDKSGNLEIELSDTVIKAKGHNIVTDPAVAPTCVKEGLTEGKHCSECGKVTVKQNTVSKLDHTYSWVVDKEPTETSTGLKHEQCSCGSKRNENTVIEKKQCAHSMTKTPAVSATCEKSGNIEYYTCSKCSKIFTDKNGSLEISKTDTVIKAKGHNIVTDAAVAPTCVKEGLTEGKHCSECGKVTVKQNTVSKLSHSYGDWKETKAPTCTAAGSKAKVCACGAQVTESVAALGHDYVNKVCSRCEGITASTGLHLLLLDNGSYIVAGIGSCTDNIVAIPDTYEGKKVTAIGPWAFYGVSQITEIKIPAGITAIGKGAFNNCKNLESIFVVSSSKSFKSINGVLYDHAGETLIQYPAKMTGKNVTLPSAVKSIACGAFMNVTDMESITLHSGISYIGSNAFEGCSSLKSVNIPSTILKIEDRTFYNCSALTSVTIGNGVTEIGDYAFCGCSSVKTVTLPSTLTTLSANAFDGCSSVENYTVTNGTNFKTENGVLFNAAGDTLVKYPIGRAVTSYTIPSSVKTIGIGAFEDAVKLTGISIPGTVTEIGERAFLGCTGITSISIPGVSGVRMNIDRDAFAGCTSLKTFEMPYTVKVLGDNVFDNCPSLTAINVHADNTRYISANGVLFKKDGTLLIKYPAGKTDSKYTIPSGVTVICARAFADSLSLKEISFPSGNIDIEPYAFEGCTALWNVDFGSASIKSIQMGAFYGCTSIPQFTLPSTVTEIAPYTFAGCTGLKWVKIPDSVTKIGPNAFMGCTAMTEATFAKTNGWTVYPDETLTMGKLLPTGQLSNKTNAKNNLTANYLEYIWIRG